MRHTPHFLMTDPEEVKRLIRGNPWATFVSPTAFEWGVGLEPTSPSRFLCVFPSDDCEPSLRPTGPLDR